MLVVLEEEEAVEEEVEEEEAAEVNFHTLLSLHMAQLPVNMYFQGSPEYIYIYL